MLLIQYDIHNIASAFDGSAHPTHISDMNTSVEHCAAYPNHM